MKEDEKQILIGFLIGSVNILRDNNIEFTEKSRNKLADKIELLLDLYNKEKDKNKQKDIITNLYKTMYNEIEKDYIRKDKIVKIIKQLEKEQEENRRNFSLGIELLSNTIIDKFSNKIMINLGIREYLENILKEKKENG